MRRPTANGQGKLLGLGVPHVGPDAQTARELRARNAAREADPTLKAAHYKATLFGVAKRNAKKDVTLPTLKFMEDRNDA